MKGFGLIETIVAIGLFSVLATVGVVGFIPALHLGRTGEEQTQAVALAREGQEAVRSIRDRDFAVLSNGNYGIGISSSQWVFSGTSDVLDKYTRQIILTKASRDTGGSLVASGGTTDPDTFLVNSKVTWNYSAGDTRTVSVANYLTNWRKPIGGIGYNGMVVYGRGNSFPYWRTYTQSSNTLSVANTLPSLVGNPRNFVIRTSPQKSEAIMGTLSTDGKLYIYCTDGTTWTQDWSVTIGVGTTRTRPFDIAYENTSGDVLVAYSTNTATTNEIAYRTKLGTDSCGSANWATSANFDPVRTSNLVSWVKLSTNPVASSNLIGMIWVDWSKDLSVAIWNGTSFANEPATVGDTGINSVNVGISFPDVEAFDLAYESLSGDLMTIWGTTVAAATNGVRYRLCTGNSATCTWGAITTPPTFADDATNLDLSANPLSDEMVFASIGKTQSDLQVGYWSGVGWTNTANVDTSAQIPVAGTKLVASGWATAGSNGRSVVTYNDSGTTNIGWYVGNRGTFTLQTDGGVTPVFANPQKWYELSQNPKSKDTLMFTLSDNNSDLFMKKLVMSTGATFTWVASDGSTQVEPNLGQNIVKPFGFTWWTK